MVVGCKRSSWKRVDGGMEVVLTRSSGAPILAAAAPAASESGKLTPVDTKTVSAVSHNAATAEPVS